VLITEEHAQQFDAMPYIKCHVLAGGADIAREYAEMLAQK
jgi:hypothetical protein